MAASRPPVYADEPDLLVVEVSEDDRVVVTEPVLDPDLDPDLDPGLALAPAPEVDLEVITGPEPALAATPRTDLVGPPETGVDARVPTVVERGAFARALCPRCDWSGPARRARAVAVKDAQHHAEQHAEQQAEQQADQQTER